MKHSRALVDAFRDHISYDHGMVMEARKLKDLSVLEVHYRVEQHFQECEGTPRLQDIWGLETEVPEFRSVDNQQVVVRLQTVHSRRGMIRAENTTFEDLHQLVCQLEYDEILRILPRRFLRQVVESDFAAQLQESGG